MSSLVLYFGYKVLHIVKTHSFIHSFHKYNYVAYVLGPGYDANKIHVAFIFIEYNVSRGILTSKEESKAWCFDVI